MRSSILLLVLLAAVLGGCTSAYKTGQTPDDVYYSPQRPQDEYVNVQDNDNSRYYGDDQYYDDQYLRMKVHNRAMWSNLDDWYYYNPGYSYSYYNSWNWNNPWSPYTYWNYFYNPYCSPVIITSNTNFAYNHPRMFNLNSYNSSQLANNNYTNPKGANYSNYNGNNTGPRINNSYVPVNRNNNTGNFLRNIFNGSSGNNNSSFNTERSSGSAGSSGSSRSSSSGSSNSAPVRKF